MKRTNLFVKVWLFACVHPSLQHAEMDHQRLGLGVALGNLGLNLDLGVGQPTGQLLDEGQVKEVVFKSREISGKNCIIF